MSFPNLLFKSCPHCGGTTWEPRPVCPSCDWPRCHLDETPVPENLGGFPDPSKAAQPQGGALVDPLKPGAVLPTVSAPAAMPVLPEVSLDAPPSVARLTSLTLADDPEETKDVA